MSVQCIYCQQVRAKNTTRQRAHLLKCEGYLRAHPDTFSGEAAAVAAGSADGEEGGDGADAYGEPSNLDASGEHPHTALGFTPNPRINGTPTARGRPSLGGQPSAKKQKTKSLSGLEIPLHEVHAAFEEFKANDEDKTVSARCNYCGQTRAKNTSRQREHLLACPGYQNVLKEKIPANNLRHHFDEHDVASSLAIPAPIINLDFRMSIRVKPKLNVGIGNFGRLGWVSCVGGQWAGRWGKGTVLACSPT